MLVSKSKTRMILSSVLSKIMSFSTGFLNFYSHRDPLSQMKRLNN